MMGILIFVRVLMLFMALTLTFDYINKVIKGRPILAGNIIFMAIGWAGYYSTLQF